MLPNASDRTLLNNCLTGLTVATESIEAAIRDHRQANFLSAHVYDADIVQELEKLYGKLRVAQVACRQIMAGNCIDARFGGLPANAPHCSR